MLRTMVVVGAVALLATALAVAAGGLPRRDAAEPTDPPEHVGATATWSPAAELAAAPADPGLPATHAEQLAEERALHEALNAVEARLAEDLHMLVTFALSILDLDPRATLSVLGVGDTAEYALVPAGAS